MGKTHKPHSNGGEEREAAKKAKEHDQAEEFEETTAAETRATGAPVPHESAAPGRAGAARPGVEVGDPAPGPQPQQILAPLSLVTYHPIGQWFDSQEKAQLLAAYTTSGAPDPEFGYCDLLVPPLPNRNNYDPAGLVVASWAGYSRQGGAGGFTQLATVYGLEGVFQGVVLEWADLAFPGPSTVGVTVPVYGFTLLWKLTDASFRNLGSLIFSAPIPLSHGQTLTIVKARGPWIGGSWVDAVTVG